MVVLSEDIPQAIAMDWRMIQSYPRGGTIMKREPIFELGVRRDTNFSGTAHVNLLVADQAGTYDTQVYDVVFEPGCRNDWHAHPGGQLLLCTDGVGYYQEEGKPARRLTRGDVVEIPPNAVHWHGASPDQAFTHIGISPNLHTGPIHWIRPVTEAEYADAVATP